MLQLKGESGWTGYTPYLGGLAQTLGSETYSVNICCLNSGWGSFSKSKPHSSLGTMQAWFPTGEPVHGCGSCPLNLPPHWLFQVGAGPHFPLMEWFPILSHWCFSPFLPSFLSKNKSKSFSENHGNMTKVSLNGLPLCNSETVWVPTTHRLESIQ